MAERRVPLCPCVGSLKVGSKAVVPFMRRMKREQRSRAAAFFADWIIRYRKFLCSRKKELCRVLFCVMEHPQRNFLYRCHKQGSWKPTEWDSSRSEGLFSMFPSSSARTCKHRKHSPFSLEESLVSKPNPVYAHEGIWGATVRVLQHRVSLSHDKLTRERVKRAPGQQRADPVEVANIFNARSS